MTHNICKLLQTIKFWGLASVNIDFMSYKDFGKRRKLLALSVFYEQMNMQVLTRE